MMKFSVKEAMSALQQRKSGKMRTKLEIETELARIQDAISVYRKLEIENCLDHGELNRIGELREERDLLMWVLGKSE